jgi:hypothetical protein
VAENSIGSFVAEQVARLEQAVNGQAGGLKLAYFSGHDTTRTSSLFPLGWKMTSELTPP